MLATNNSSTHKVYDSRWSAFASWCGEQRLDPTVAPVAVALYFLTSILPNSGTNTLKGYVSAISSTHALVDDCS
jgi:hypothetical protein